MRKQDDSYNETPNLGRRIFSSILLSMLFLVCYGLSNKVTMELGNANVYKFSWESFIPFWSFMIVPYMSLDAFFVAAPFLVRNQSELSNLEKKISFSILFSCLCFIFVPLKCTFEKPQVFGTLGWIFTNFLRMDQPFNQLPSLHIVLSFILGDFYQQRTKGIWRWLSNTWFVLIGLSTVFTYQHHIIDVIGGCLIGIVFVLIFRKPHTTDTCNRKRIGYIYGFAGIFGGLPAMLKGGSWMILLTWISLSLIIISAAYIRFGGEFLPKFSTSNAFFKKIILFPVTLGHQISHLYYSWLHDYSGTPWNSLTENVWIGRLLFEKEAVLAKNIGVAAVIDLSAELPECRSFDGLHYLKLPILDLTAPSVEQIKKAIEFIDEHSKNSIVYVHCKVGYSRTAALAGCWLLHSGIVKKSDEALDHLHKTRTGIIIRPEAEQTIRNWSDRCCQI